MLAIIAYNSRYHSCGLFVQHASIGNKGKFKYDAIFTLTSVFLIVFSARKNVDSLRRCMENVVIPIFCVTSCQASDEQQPKLQKVCPLESVFFIFRFSKEMQTTYLWSTEG